MVLHPSLFPPSLSYFIPIPWNALLLTLLPLSPPPRPFLMHVHVLG